MDDNKVLTEGKLVIAPTKIRGDVSFGHALMVWAAATLIGAVTMVLRLMSGRPLLDIFDLRGIGFRHDTGVTAVMVTIEALIVAAVIQIISIVVLLISVSQENVLAVQLWTGIYKILNANLTNIPMIAVIFYYISALGGNDNLLYYAGAIVIVAAFHVGLGALFTMNLNFHFGDVNGDLQPFAEDEILADDYSQDPNAYEMTVRNSTIES